LLVPPHAPPDGYNAANPKPTVLVTVTFTTTAATPDNGTPEHVPDTCTTRVPPG
jgi:hypothetical protein